MVNDPYYSSVAALLHMEGANGGSTFTDDKGSTVGTNGSPVTSTAVAAAGGSSALFDGNTAYLALPNDGGRFDFQAGDWTIEFAAYTNSASVSKRVISAWDNTSFSIVATPSYWDLYLNGAYRASWGTNTTGVWQHLAVVRSGNTLYMFQDGVLLNTLSFSSYIPDLGSSVVSVGGFGSGANSYDGYMDELRITKGVARYTSDYTLQSGEFPGALVVTGTVTDVSSTAIPFAPVRVYARSTGKLVSSVTAASDGTFTAPAAAGDNYVVALDPAGLLNASIFDLVQGV